MDEKDKQIKLSKFLLQKYSDIINEREQRTIGEIKALVDGTDLSIQTIIEEFKETTYSFEDNYLEILKKIYSFIIEEIEFTEVNFGINYWLNAKEVLEIKIADDEDLAVFTCSFMKALGDNKAEVIIAELDNLTTHAFVTTEINENFLILDPAQKKEFKTFFGEKTKILRNYAFKEQKIKKFLYRFNSEKYEQFLE
ncbi:MAG: transglutaminase-like domain-containing protein [Candidatus ainarchaeum sp.]|nr:transglutaminase-like domain-containing protein [Candidatus ainarchaeum sp.]